jgi:hypothetical protein
MPSFSRCHDLLLLRGAFDLPSRSSALRSIAAGHRGGRCRCRRLRWPRGVFWPPDRCRRRSRRRGLRCSCPRGFPTFRFIRGGRFIGSRRGSSIRWPGRRLHRGTILRAMGPSGRWARRRRPTHSCIARASEARPHRTNRATAANARNKRNDNGGAPVSSRMRSPQMSPVSLPVLDFRHAKHDRSTLGGTAWPAVVARHRGVTMVPIILAAIGAACSGSGASMSTVCAIPTSAYGYGSTCCRVEPAEQNCEVTNGATVFQDWAVENGTKTCTSSCPAGQFYLACDGPLGTVGPAPSPDPSLNCKGAGGPAGGGYCCACAP